MRANTSRTTLIKWANDHSLLISGPRGIGKSSLSVQLQSVLDGNKTLLKRCALDLKIPNFITISYVCLSDDTLESLVEGIINELNRKLALIEPKYRIKNTTFDISILGIIKGVRQQPPELYLALIRRLSDRFLLYYT